MGLFKFVKKAGQSYADLQRKHFEVLKDIVGLDGKIGIGGKEKKSEPVTAGENSGPRPVASTPVPPPAAPKPVKPPAPWATEKAVIIAAEAKSHGLEGDYHVEVKGDTVTVSGHVPDQETLEKIVLSSGNVEGIGTVDVTAVKVSAPGETSLLHTVKKGDTLSKLAKRYFGDAMRYPEIFNANRPMLKDPDEIYPGQVLRVPDGQAPDAQA